jgi:hypothetical protein
MMQTLKWTLLGLAIQEHQVLSSEPILFTKFANWAYEKEVRCFRSFFEVRLVFSGEGGALESHWCIAFTRLSAICCQRSRALK